MSTDTAQQPVPADFEMDMGALLESEAAQPGHLRRGEIVEGMVMGASADGLIVDVGTKTEAVSIQAVSPLLGVGASAASAGARPARRIAARIAAGAAIGNRRETGRGMAVMVPPLGRTRVGETTSHATPAHPFPQELCQPPQGL